MKYYTYNGTKVRLEKEEYQSNGTIALAMYTKDGELYDVVTVNLQDRMQSDSMAYLDVNNHPIPFVHHNALRIWKWQTTSSRF